MWGNCGLKKNGASAGVIFSPATPANKVYPFIAYRCFKKRSLQPSKQNGTGISSRVSLLNE